MCDKKYHLKGYLKIPFDEVITASDIEDAKATIEWDMGGEYFCCFDKEDFVYEIVEED